MSYEISYYKVNDKAKEPVYSTQHAACFDLHARLDQPVWIHPGQTRLIPTGLIFDIIEGWQIKLYSRSGLAAKNSVHLGNGVGIIDSDYTDEVKIILTNSGTEPFLVSDGMRIAQGQLELVTRIKFYEVFEPVEKKGDRTGGFGSTGV